MVFPIRSNPLLYPAGTPAGVNWAHPASINLIMSAIAASNKNVTSLVTPRNPGTPSGTYGGTVTDSILGPVLSTPTGSATLTVPLAPRTTASAVTIAGIIRPSNLSGFGTIVEDNGSLFGLLLSPGVPRYYPGAKEPTGITLSVNIPYFVAMSGLGSLHDFVVMNLQTGKLQTGTNATAFTGGSINTGVFIGGDAGGDTLANYLAAAMMSFTRTPMTELIEWAKDPWSFWYPRINVPIVAAAAAAAAGGAFSVIQDSAQGSVEMIGY